jgi:hypothetical protein
MMEPVHLKPRVARKRTLVFVPGPGFLKRLLHVSADRISYEELITLMDDAMRCRKHQHLDHAHQAASTYSPRHSRIGIKMAGAVDGSSVGSEIENAQGRRGSIFAGAWAAGITWTSLKRETGTLAFLLMITDGHHERRGRENIATTIEGREDIHQRAS